jgi:methionine aminopeptidase
MCIPDASVHDICKGGDDLVNELTKNLYQKKVNGRKIDKGIAFPICVSVNDCICHMSPLTSEEPVSISISICICTVCIHAMHIFAVVMLLLCN